MAQKPDHVKDYQRWQKLYDKRWLSFTDVLYDLCRRKFPDHEDVGEIEAKLLLVGRGLATEMERRIKIDKRAGSAIATVANHLYKKRKKVDAIIRRLQAIKTLPDIETMEVIVEQHATFCEIVAEATEGRRYRLTSFASKYLHFHAPIVPIYDKYAGRGASRIRRDLPALKPAKLHGTGDAKYVKYCKNFLPVLQRFCRGKARADVRRVEVFMYYTGRAAAK